jgi:hypothetical protein
MELSEFKPRFNLLYNNITSNQAPGLDEYEISVFLTMGQKEIIKNYFSPKGNPRKEGFDDSAKRQADFSMLTKVAKCQEVEIKGTIIWNDSLSEEPQELTYDDVELQNSETGEYVSWNIIPIDNIFAVESNGSDVCIVYDDVKYNLKGFGMRVGDTIINKGFNVVKLDERSKVFKLPSDVFIVTNEVYTTGNKTLQVVPLRYDTYTRLMTKPYKWPVKREAWRLSNSGKWAGNECNRIVELLIGPEAENATGSYTISYIRQPKPIIIATLDGLTIDGYCFTEDSTPGAKKTSGCELDPSLHDEILHRAVELAKAAWQGDLNTTIQLGQRTE